MEMKRCKDCGLEKSLSEFGKQPRNKDGHTGKCKACTKKYLVAWQKANPEKVKAFAAKYRNARNEWTSVDECEPARHKMYLVCDRSCIVHQAYYTPDGEWIAAFGHEILSATHWRRLPALPTN